MKTIINKKRIRIHLFFWVIVTSLFSGCKEEELGNVADISGLGGDVWVKGPIDQWIYDSLTVPYNISVKYKWDQFEFNNLTRTLVPADESQVLPLLRTIRNIWITPYVEDAGLTFFNKYSPKTFVLAGSNEYNTDGSVTLGTAEGGRKVILFAVNDFKVKGMPGYQAADSSFVKQWFFQTIHHEFAHILHQNKLYPQEYKQISSGLYQGGNWINFSDNDARKDGFVTSYSTSSFSEDFVEMIAVMLLEGKGGFDRIVNSIPEGNSINGTSKAQAQAALRTKEEMIVSYYKTAWNVDFYSLQAKTKAALTKVL